jgi:broad-specificity NMP kinase
MKHKDKYLITGRGGTGKSTVNLELIRRGRNSIDGDDKSLGLAAWRNLSTGERVVVENPDSVDTSVIDWLWDRATLEKIVSAPGELFLCGSAENDLEFFSEFSLVFVLDLEPNEHLSRLQSRSDNYGKDEAKQAQILDWQKQLVKDASALGATVIDASKPVENVVNDILAHLK